MVTHPKTGETFTISAVLRSGWTPRIDGEKLAMQYDIALFEGRLGVLGGLKKPLARFFIARGSDLRLQELVDRLEEGLVEPDMPNMRAVVWALVNDDWIFLTREEPDPYHGNKPVTDTYVWP